MSTLHNKKKKEMKESGSIPLNNSMFGLRTRKTTLDRVVCLTATWFIFYLDAKIHNNRLSRIRAHKLWLKVDLTCNSVEEHEVLKVGDLSPLPALRHVGGLEELTWGGQWNPPRMDTCTCWNRFPFYQSRKLSLQPRTALDLLTTPCTYLACGSP